MVLLVSYNVSSELLPHYANGPSDMVVDTDDLTDWDQHGWDRRIAILKHHVARFHEGGPEKSDIGITNLINLSSYE